MHGLLPRGVDVLAARATEMALQGHGRLSRGEVQALQTAAALAARLLAARVAISAKDGKPAPNRSDDGRFSPATPAKRRPTTGF